MTALALGPALNARTEGAVLVGFMLFVAVALFVCVFAGPDRDRIAEFYTARGGLSRLQAVLALGGEYISAASLLGTTGVIALAGFDGLSVAACSVLSVGVLLLFAGPLRAAGGFTLGDVMAERSADRALRIASATATLGIALPFLVVQLSGAGAIIALFVGLTSTGAQTACTVMIGILMIVFALLGGMRGTSLVQILKLLVLGTAMVAMTVAVLAHFHGSLPALLDAARAGSGRPAGYLKPGLWYGSGTSGKWNVFSLEATVILGGAMMPHMTMRINTQQDPAGARRAVRYAIGVVAPLFVCLTVLGLGTAALVGDRVLAAIDPHGGSALLLLAGSLGGGPGTAAGGTLFTLMACGVFITALAVVTGTTLAAAASLAHDVYAQVLRRGRLAERDEVRAVRWSILAVGAAGLLLTIAFQGWYIQFLTQFAMGVAASTVLPALVYRLFWPAASRTGLLCTLYGGLIASVVLQVLSPTVSGSRDALFPHAHFDWFPLETSTLVAVPLAFLLGWLGSRLAPDPAELKGAVATAHLVV